MSLVGRFRSLVSASCIVALSIVVLSTAYAAAAQAPDAAAHKQWMNDASEAQEDFRFAVTDKDQKAATAALGKLEDLMAKTGEYWAARKASDGVKLSRDAHDLAAQAGAAARAGNMPAASQAFDKMGATCNTCHELHLEKR
jgi:hypothetical protein